MTVDPMYRVKLPVVKQKHINLAKFCGGTLWFWILWRTKHDWRTLFVSIEYASVQFSLQNTVIHFVSRIFIVI